MSSSDSKSPPAAAFLRKQIHSDEANTVDPNNAKEDHVSNLSPSNINSEVTEKAAISEDSTIPYRGFGNTSIQPSSTTITATPPKLRHNIGSRLRNLFSPRNTDLQLLLTKLDAQFQKLDMLMEVEQQKDNYDGSGVTDKNDPTHPLNNSEIISDIHYVGRSALDSSIVELSNFLSKRDVFGCITELWLNNNFISDDGASAIATLLQSPKCALVELWLGDNQIGPVGVSMLAAALSTNESSQLKCLGLYKNPIQNGGANSLAQMLRTNHTLTTVDVHGCLYDEKKNNTVVESYGCRVVTSTDGTEYVAKVVASNPQEKVGHVTDSRLIDAIKTFAAFNRIDPTREQVIRGLSSSNANSQGAFVGSKLDDSSTKNERQHHTTVSAFLSDLCNKPSNEKLTVEEKRKWKECEWERLYVEIERARAAARIMAERLQIKTAEEVSGEDLFADEPDEKSECDRTESEEFQLEQLGRDLDNEVVRTGAKTLRDLKIGITGCPSPRRENDRVSKSGGKPFENAPANAGEEGTNPSENPIDDEVTSDEAKTQGMSDASLRLMKMVNDLENAQNSRPKDQNKSKIDSNSEPIPEERSVENPSTQMFRRSETSESYDAYKKSVQASKDTLSSAMDFLKELDQDPSIKSD